MTRKPKRKRSGSLPIYVAAGPTRRELAEARKLFGRQEVADPTQGRKETKPTITDKAKKETQ